MRADAQAEKPANASGAATLTVTELQQRRSDDWGNVYTALGTGKDKRLGTRITTAKRWNRQELVEAYRGSDLVATLVDLPADEMVREWITFCADNDPEHELNSAVLDFLEGSDEGPEEDQGLQARKAFHDWLKRGRLHGGSAIVMGINDGQPSNKPVNFNAIKSVDFLNVLDRWAIIPFTYYTDPLAKKFGQVQMYEVLNTFPGAAARPDRMLVHESRVIRMDAVELAPQDAYENNSWGDSVLTRVWEVIRDYASVWMSFAYLLADYAQTTIKIEGLAQAIAAPDGKQIIARRMEAIEMCRSISRAVLLDAGRGDNKGEEFKRETTNLAGVPDAMQKFVERLAQAARMPIELLMGQPPGGINGNGETGMTYWYSQIGAMQENILRPALLKLMRVVLSAQNGPTGGSVPDQWSVEFTALDAPTEAERADILVKIATAGAALVNAQILDPEEVANSFFGSGKLSLDIKLDAAIRKQMAAQMEQSRAPGPSPEELAAAAQAKVAQAQQKGAPSVVQPA